MKVTPSLLLLASIAFAARAGEPAREPWRLTTEERLAIRFDRSAQRMRVAMSAAAPGFGTRELPSDVVDGRTHPELFFPTELFERFVKTMYADRLENYRESIQQRSDDVLRKDEDWKILDKAVAAYAANLSDDLRLYLESSRATRVRQREIDVQLNRLRDSRCALEKEAFRRVHAAFGAERFDRFLYVVAAPGFSTAYSSDHDFAQTRKWLVEREEACK